MKPELREIHVKALLDFLQSRGIHPIEALTTLTIAGTALLGTYTENVLDPDEKLSLQAETEDLVIEIRKFMETRADDLIPTLLAVHSLYRELIEVMDMKFEQHKSAATK